VLSHLWRKIAFEIDLKLSFFASNAINILKISRKSFRQREETKSFVLAVNRGEEGTIAMRYSDNATLRFGVIA
jgi:hypothetical protein